jgi:hypothetical protein
MLYLLVGQRTAGRNKERGLGARRAALEGCYVKKKFERKIVPYFIIRDLRRRDFLAG